jgi:FixJ family two-component response regulator
MTDQTPRELIVIVEDDDAVRRSLQLFLHWRGYDVRAFASATRLLESDGSGHAAALIADYRLPDGDGIAVLRTMRGAGWDGRAVLLTGHGSPELPEAALASGFDAVLDKPLRQHELVGALGR